jgi:hypothetical protein
MRALRIVALGVVIAIALVACGGGKSSGKSSGPSAPTTTAVGPAIYDPSLPSTAWHWHVALGVYDCGVWMGDQPGSGVWEWPAATPSEEPARADDPNTYAGLHSHDDGLIHMEPATPDEAGKNPTVGRYFAYGGWTVSATGFSFLDTTRANGEPCNAKPGKLQWWVNGKAHTGDPAAYKLYDRDVVVLAFLPAGAAYPGPPPSAKNLP